MADSNFRSDESKNRSIRPTDLVFGADPSKADFSDAGRSDILTEFIKTILTNASADLTPAQMETVLGRLGTVSTRYAIGTTYDPVLRYLRIDLMPFPRYGWEAWFILPDVIERSVNVVKIRFESDILLVPLLDIRGRAVSADKLTPGELTAILRTGDGARIIFPLNPRPQDFVIHMFAIEYPTQIGMQDDLDSEDHVLTQALVDNMVAHTMSTLISPRVNWPDNFVYSRAFDDSTEDTAYEDFTNVWLYYGVPDVAPNIRGRGRGDNDGYGGSPLSRVSDDARVAGTFLIGGVPHKFIRILVQPGGDFVNDPPTDWEPLRDNGEYVLMAFDGLPDPSSGD